MKKTLITLATIAAFTVPTAQAEVIKATHKVTASAKTDNTAKAQAYLDQFTKKPEVKQSWDVNKQGIPWAMSEDLGWKAIAMMPEKKVIFQGINEPCSARLKTKVIPVYVNDQKTEFLSMCHHGYLFYMPAGDVFNEIVFNEFKRKNSVKVGAKTVTAKGFTKAISGK